MKSRYEQESKKQDRSILSKQRFFWLGEFSQELTVSNLPIDSPRSKVKNHPARSKRFSLDNETVEDLGELGKKSGATMFMTILSILNVLLSKLSDKEDIVIGTPVTICLSKSKKETTQNTLALRNFPKRDLVFDDFLKEVKERTLLCFNNQLYPHEKLIEELSLVRDSSRNPLFDVMFSLQNNREERDVSVISDLGDISSRNESNADLRVSAVESTDQLEFVIEYSDVLFEDSTIDRFISYFQRLIKEVVHDSSKKISELEILSNEECEQLLHTFNNTSTDYPRNKTVIDLFEEHVAKAPSKTALIFKGKEMDYSSFSSKVDSVFKALVAKGVNEGDVVGIMSTSGFDLLSGIYGIMKSGAVYLPLDPSYPEERIKYILEDSGARLLLLPKDYEVKVCEDFDTLVIGDLEKYSRSAHGKVLSKARPSGLAYVIYTSGSTGDPKGVMIEHRSLLHSINWLHCQYQIDGTDLFLQKTPIVFDVSMCELFGWSRCGATLCLLEQGEERDPARISKVVKDHRVSILHFVPSVLRVFLDYVEAEQFCSGLSSVRKVFSNGETLHPELVNRFNRLLKKENQTILINLYGPTETTIHVSHFDCSDKKQDNQVPIGRPISNIQLYVLGHGNALLPLGVTGELCIGGIGLARGYVNNGDFTGQKFIEHPFKEGAKLYKTGDLARWLPDGNIEFLGRSDDQLKIRGFRIELGEIESRLNKYVDVKQSAVLARGGEANKNLVAYYVSKEELRITALQTYLSEFLPDYMVPLYYVHMRDFPLTANGKLDKKSLPEPHVWTDNDYVGPSNEIEETLVKLWSKVLKLDRRVISTNRDYSELGGNSINAMLLRNRIRKCFKIDISLTELFEKKTIEKLSQYIIAITQFETNGSQENNEIII